MLGGKWIDRRNGKNNNGHLKRVEGAVNQLENSVSALNASIMLQNELHDRDWGDINDKLDKILELVA